MVDEWSSQEAMGCRLLGSSVVYRSEWPDLPVVTHHDHATPIIFAPKNKQPEMILHTTSVLYSSFQFYRQHFHLW
jgi:hypothetical protein